MVLARDHALYLGRPRPGNRRPGNAVRMAQVKPDHSLTSLRIYCQNWGTILAGWVIDPKLIIATLLLLAIPRFRSLRPAWLCNRSIVWKLGVVSCFVTVLTVLIAGPWWALGSVPPGRTQSGIYLIFLIGWFLLLLVFNSPGIATTSQSFGLPLRSRAALGLFFGASLLTLGNFPVAVRDLYGTARPYKNAMQHRYEMIGEAKTRGEQNFLLPPLTAIPACFDYCADLVEPDSNAPNKFVNLHYARYFGFQSLALRKGSSTR